jgi:hypothetical protein
MVGMMAIAKVGLMAQKTVASLAVQLVDLLGKTVGVLSAQNQDYLTVEQMVWTAAEVMEVSKAYQMVA